MQANVVTASGASTANLVVEGASATGGPSPVKLSGGKVSAEVIDNEKAVNSHADSAQKEAASMASKEIE